LEISAALAAALGGRGAQIQVRVASGEMRGMVTVMECTCAKASTSGKHEHHFVQCEAFRDLAIGSDLALSADVARLEVALG
ncbi:MAG: hypothetical protein ACREOG_13365, partial [Gemmatimonadaceae bacterium]